MTHYLLITLCGIVIRILMQSAASGKIEETHGSVHMSGVFTGMNAGGNILIQTARGDL